MSSRLHQTNTKCIGYSDIIDTSALRLLALRELRTLHVRNRANGPQLGEKLTKIVQI